MRVLVSVGRKSIQAASDQQSASAEEMHEWYCDNAIRILKRARAHGQRPQLSWFTGTSLSPLHVDLDVLRSRKDLQDVIENVLLLNWQMQFFAWDETEPMKPPANWNAVIGGVPLAAFQSAGMNWNWGANPPANGLPPDHFAVVATSTFQSNEGDYVCEFVFDDGIRAYLDDVLILDRWDRSGFASDRVQQHLSKGEHRLRLEYFEIDAWATLSAAVYPAGR